MTLWKPRELDVVETLTRRVSVLSLGQIARGWWPEEVSGKGVRRQLRRLREGGLLHRAFVNVSPLPEPRGPVLTWQPEQTAPNLELIARRLQARFREPAEPTEVYWSSRQAANLFGSTARELPSLSHRDHDLWLAEVYVFYRRHRSDAAARWWGEHVFPKAGYRLKDPDAFLCADDGRVLRIVESAGRYGLKQLLAFHEHCCEFDLSYELW
jgi:hypothetical protein